MGVGVGVHMAGQERGLGRGSKGMRQDRTDVVVVGVVAAAAGRRWAVDHIAQAEEARQGKRASAGAQIHKPIRSGTQGSI